MGRNPSGAGRAAARRQERTGRGGESGPGRERERREQGIGRQVLHSAQQMVTRASGINFLHA